jgi:AraC family transcriptional regulator
MALRGDDVREGRAEATIRQLYQGPYLRIADFATSGRQGGGWESAEHSHEAIQITIVSAESCVQADWLTDYGSKRAKRISGSAICITPANQPHSMEWNESRGSIMMLISANLLGAELNSSARSGSIVHEGYGFCDPFVQHLGTLLQQAALSGAAITRLQAESTAVVLLHHLSGRVESSRTAQVPTCERLPQVVEYIDANLADELSIAALAQVARTSQFHFARLFKAAKGVTPHQYVLERRIELAKRLLLDRHLSIAGVSNACGFATQAHLTTVFHRMVGVPPRAYRGYLAFADLDSARTGKRSAAI